jgi:biotin synthase-like enzyme
MEVIEMARRAKENGSTRFCMGKKGGRDSIELLDMSTSKNSKENKKVYRISHPKHFL